MSKRENNVKQGPCEYCIGSNALRKSWQIYDKYVYPASARIDYSFILNYWEISLIGVDGAMKAGVKHCPMCGRLLPCL